MPDWLVTLVWRVRRRIPNGTESVDVKIEGSPTRKQLENLKDVCQMLDVPNPTQKQIGSNDGS